MKKFRLYCMICLIAICLCGCLSETGADDMASDDALLDKGFAMIYESTISPNEEYVQDEADKVFYTVQIYQGQDNKIVVNADSNSAFFKDVQYEVAHNGAISQSDVTVTWTTLMGSTEYTEENQLAVADIALYADGEVFSERKINFFNGGIDIVTDTINQTAE